MDFEIIDEYDFITCRICGKKSKRLYGLHLKYHNLTSEQYLELHPEAPLMAEVDKEKMGKHMKQDYYKEMFKEKFSGDKNPNHKSKTTEEYRKTLSPFSKSFVKYKDVENKEEVVSEFAKKALKDRVTATQLEYYIQQGHDIQEAEKLLSQRQITFSLEKCIEKYGKSKGTKIWKQRQEKWLKNYKKVNYSKISQELFVELFSKLKSTGFDKRVYFATFDGQEIVHNSNKNYEFRLKLKDKVVVPDFFIPELKLIIEFDGTYYHRQTPENKKREMVRDQNIIEGGYSVIHISEKEYSNDKQNTVFKLFESIMKIDKEND